MSEPLTDADLAAIEARLTAATEQRAMARLVALRDDAAALLAEVRRLRAELAMRTPLADVAGAVIP